MKIKTDKRLAAFILIISISILRCSSYPSSKEKLAKNVFSAFENKNFTRLWQMCMQNPDVRKYSLIALLRSGQITKKVYQRDMGRVVFLEKQEKGKLKQDYERILNLIKNLNIAPEYMGIKNSDKDKKFVTIRIGKPNHSISVNIHYEEIDGEYFLISLYSIN